MSAATVPVVLIAEDDDAHAELIARSLESSECACDARRVSDGDEALDYLFRRGGYADASASPAPQLVILDLRLPRVGGVQVLAEMRADRRLRRVPVVVLTTSEAPGDIAAAYDAGASSYVVKPSGLGELRALMRALGDYWLCWNRRG